MASDKIIKSFTLDLNAATWLEEQARAENRNLSNFLETWVLRAMAKQSTTSDATEEVAA